MTEAQRNPAVAGTASPNPADLGTVKPNPADTEIAKPNPAGMYDFWLGGTANSPADR